MRLLIIIILTTSAFGVSYWNQKSNEEISLEANGFMWDQLHRGNYDSIPAIIDRLNEAYNNNPEDPATTAHLGFVHLWAFSERVRHAPDSSIAGHVILSNRFFKEAIALDPEDARLKGFQSATDICEGAISLKLFMIARGYVNGFRSVNEWPQFNKFAVSLIGSQSRKNSPLYQLAIKYQWELINDCSCRDLDKKTIMKDPARIFKDLFAELERNNDPLINRACKNSWIAPHNLEGFFLNFGDMLVKQGKFREAAEIYKAAKLCPGYKEWPFAKVIDQRIADIKVNNGLFNRPLELINIPEGTQLFINSEMSCVACHQMSKKEFEKFGPARLVSLSN